MRYKEKPYYPECFVKIRDLQTGEVVPAGNDVVSCEVNASIGNVGHAKFSLTDKNDRWHPAQSKGRHNIWTIFSGSFFNEKNESNKGMERFYLRNRDYSAEGRKSVYTNSRSQALEFIHEIFKEPLMKELREDRRKLWTEISNVVGKTPGPSARPPESLLNEYFNIMSTIMLRSDVSIDFKDFNGNVFGVFTGFISDIEESYVPGQMPTISVSCKDFLHLARLGVIPIKEALNAFDRLVQHKLAVKNITLKKNVVMENPLYDLSISQIMEFLVKVVNMSFSMRGMMDALEDQGISMSSNKVQRNTQGMFWELKYDVALAQNEVVKIRSTRMERIWDKNDDGTFEREYVGGMNRVYDDLFRSSGYLYLDKRLSDSNPDRVGFAKTFKIGMRTSWDLWRDTLASPFDILTEMNSKLFGDFYCDGMGNLVLKLPDYNSIPDSQPTNFKRGDYVTESFERIDLAHGSEYILQDYGLVHMSFSETLDGKYTRIRVQGETDYLDSLPDIMRMVLKGWALASPEAESFFGFRELACSQVMKSMPEYGLKAFANGLLCMLNYRNFRMNAIYDKPLPWELGKTVYLPNKDMLYYIDNLKWNFQKGSHLKCIIGAGFGHPARKILPVPWLLQCDQVEISPSSPMKRSESPLKTKVVMSTAVSSDAKIMQEALEKNKNVVVTQKPEEKDGTLKKQPSLNVKLVLTDEEQLDKARILEERKINSKEKTKQ